MIYVIYIYIYIIHSPSRLVGFFSCSCEVAVFGECEEDLFGLW